MIIVADESVDCSIVLQLSHHGVLLLRLNNLPPGKKAEIVSKIILEHMEVLINAFSVFDGINLRVRR